MSGNLVSTSSESIASVSHSLVLGLRNGSVWNPDVAREGSIAARALRSSIASAQHTGNGGTSASGWNAQLLSGKGALRWMIIRLLRNGTSVLPDDCEPPRGCSELELIIPQLAEYRIDADEMLQLRISGDAVWGNVSTPRGVGAEAVGTRLIVISADRPCEQQGGCTDCVAWRGGADTHRCSWCASSGRCVPQRDGGLLPGECPGLVTASCPRGSSSLSSNATSELATDESKHLDAVSDVQVKRIGVGVLVLNVGDVDMKAGRFYADLQVFLHVETDGNGRDRLYPKSSVVDETLAWCNSMPFWRPYQPSAEDMRRSDRGLFLVNVDRLRNVEPMFHNGSIDHFRVQSSFYFRTNITQWPMNTERLEVVLELESERMTEEVSHIFCSMPEYSGLSHTVRFPGSIDNQRLSTSVKVTENCGPPFLRPVVQCVAPPGDDGSRPTYRPLFDKTCECDKVADFLEGYDTESCGCQGGRVASSRVTFTVLYHTPEVGAFVSAFLPPIFIMVVNLGAYLIPPQAIETRFSLSNSGLIALVLFHAGLKGQTPLTGVLTTADYVMIGCYFVIGVALVVSALLLTLKFEGHQAHAQLLFRVCRPLGPTLSLLLFFGALFPPTPAMTWLSAACAALALGVLARIFFHLVSKQLNRRAHPGVELYTRFDSPDASLHSPKVSSSAQLAARATTSRTTAPSTSGAHGQAGVEMESKAREEQYESVAPHTPSAEQRRAAPAELQPAKLGNAGSTSPSGISLATACASSSTIEPAEGDATTRLLAAVVAEFREHTARQSLQLEALLEEALRLTSNQRLQPAPSHALHVTSEK